MINLKAISGGLFMGFLLGLVLAQFIRYGMHIGLGIGLAFGVGSVLLAAMGEVLGLEDPYKGRE